jgi:hypothetical protein
MVRPLSRRRINRVQFAAQKWILSRAPPRLTDFSRADWWLEAPDEEEEAEMQSLAEMLAEFETAYAPPLVTPRVPRFYQADFPEVSFWTHTRRRRVDTVFMRYLGTPLFVFDALVEYMRPHLTSYDVEHVRAGRPSRFDHVDVVAVVLRRTQLCCVRLGEALEIEFSAAHGVIERAVYHGRRALQVVLRGLHDARVERSSLAELKTAYAGVIAQHGAPPWHEWGDDWPEGKELIFGETMDGTKQAVLNPSKPKDQRSVKSKAKGVCLTHLFNFEITGVIVDYTIGAKGTFNDSRISERMLERHASLEFNPHSIGLIVDNGWRMTLCFPLPPQYSHYRTYDEDKPLVLRPAREEDHAPCKALQPYYNKGSASATTCRQYNEMGNGGLKRSYPLVTRPVRLQEARRNAEDVEMCVRLFNLRTRLVGWNTIKTMYLRHADKNFREQLKYSKDAKAYLAFAKERLEKIRQGLLVV